MQAGQALCKSGVPTKKRVDREYILRGQSPSALPPPPPATASEVDLCWHSSLLYQPLMLRGGHHLVVADNMNKLT